MNDIVKHDDSGKTLRLKSEVIVEQLTNNVHLSKSEKECLKQFADDFMYCNDGELSELTATDRISKRAMEILYRISL